MSKYKTAPVQIIDLNIERNPEIYERFWLPSVNLCQMIGYIAKKYGLPVEVPEGSAALRQDICYRLRSSNTHEQIGDKKECPVYKQLEEIFGKH